MKNTAVKYLVIATVLLLLPCAAFAHDFPHTIYACSECHNSVHNKLGDAAMYSNVCMSCHKPGSLDTSTGYYNVRTFNFRDQANPYKNDAGLNGNPNNIQMSHRWEGSDNVPEAGAQPPVNTAFYPTGRNLLRDNLYCQRCHNLSGPRSYDGYNSAPFLRTLNDQDQMCLDCHRTRNTTSHLGGSHPVSLLYSSATSKTRLKPLEYYPRPVNANASNPTSDLGPKLKSGLMVCSTCHGLHYADSNSSTFDKFSSAILGRLSSSKGYLLRTDYKTKTADGRNICMNCHRANDLPENIAMVNGLPVPTANVKNHNKKNQNIQCVDCHGGHVEFPGYSSASGRITQTEKIPNIYLINRYMNVSSNNGSYQTIRNSKVIFNDINNKNYYNQYGVCKGCHATLPQDVGEHITVRNCASCHTHKVGFSPDCTNCHGYPPVKNVAGGTEGYGKTADFDYSSDPAVFKDESISPHKIHATGDGYGFNCDECHKGKNHLTGDFQQVFLDKTDIIASKNGSNPTYGKTAPGTCSTVYCHSNGNGQAKTPSWKDQSSPDNTIVGKGQSVECNFCHNAQPDTNAHTRHVSADPNTGKGYTCVMCHAATVDESGAIINKKKHVDGNKDVQFSGFASGGSFDNSTHACNNLYCHSSGRDDVPDPVTTPKFNDVNTGKCGTCHANPPNYANKYVQNNVTTLTGNAHPAHTSAIYGPQFGTDTQGACARCHPYTGELGSKHVDGNRDVTYTLCTPCHANSMPVWTAGTVACETCHSGTLSVINSITAPDKSLAETYGHNKPSGANRACLDCHARNAQHLSSDPKSHAFRLVTSLSSAVNPNKGCNGCHFDPQVVTNPKFLNMSTHYTQKNGQHDMKCWSCHELHGTTNNSMIRTQIAYRNSTTWTVTFTNRSTGWIDRTTNRGLCQVCHTYTKFFKAGVPELNHGYDRNCWQCHVHNSKKGAFAPSGCNGCHGYPPVPRSAVIGPDDPNNYKGTFGTYGNYTNARFEDYTGGGGAHLWHVVPTAKSSDGWGPCAVCHSGGNSVAPTSHQVQMPVKSHIENVTIQIDPRFRFSDTALPFYSSARLVSPPQKNVTGSCVNVACHFQPTPKWDRNR